MTSPLPLDEWREKAARAIFPDVFRFPRTNMHKVEYDRAYNKASSVLNAIIPEIVNEIAKVADDYAKRLDEATSGAKVKSDTRIEALDRMMAAHHIASAIRDLAPKGDGNG